MANESDVGPPLGRRLSYLLKHAFLDLEDIHREYLDPLGISGRDLGVLLLLKGREPESQQQAAARLNVDRTTMVALLDGLEAKGLVVRRPDDDDRRRNVVVLTDTGQRTLAKALRASDKAERRLLGELDDAEQAQLRELLSRIAARRDRP